MDILARIEQVLMGILVRIEQVRAPSVQVTIPRWASLASVILNCLIW